MDKLRRARRCPRGEILALHQTYTEATRRGVESDSGASGSTANDEDVERIRGGGSDQSRLLSGSRRYGSAGIADPAPQGIQNRTTAAASVAGGDRGREVDSATGCGGDCGGSDG